MYFIVINLILLGFGLHPLSQDMYLFIALTRRVPCPQGTLWVWATQPTDYRHWEQSLFCAWTKIRVLFTPSDRYDSRKNSRLSQTYLGERISRTVINIALLSSMAHILRAKAYAICWGYRDNSDLLWQVEGALQIVEKNILVRPHGNHL